VDSIRQQRRMTRRRSKTKMPLMARKRERGAKWDGPDPNPRLLDGGGVDWHG
jgi:hypothetical protein